MAPAGCKIFYWSAKLIQIIESREDPDLYTPLPGNGAVSQSHQMIENKHTYPGIRDDHLVQPVFCLILPETAYRKT